MQGLLRSTTCTRIGGTCVVLDDMKTAMPGTRAASRAKSRGSASSIDALRRRYCSTMSVRPLLQMSIAAMKPTPMRTGTQPPSRIFTVLAAKKGRSNDKKRRRMPTEAGRDQPHV